jgi:hypothetical protein
MAEFQEQQLFRGAAQAQGFAPEQAFDITPLLRENMDITSTNLGRAVNARKNELESNVKRTQELYTTLGTFSEKAMQLAQTIGSAYIDNRILEGKTKMRSFGKANNYGVSPEGLAEYNAKKASIQQSDTALSEYANQIAKQGGPQEAVNYIKSLGSYEQIGATEYYLKQKGLEYRAAKDAFFSNTEFLLYDADGNQFTPSEIGDDPVRHSIATAAFGRLFLADNVGIGKDFNPNNAAMGLLYDAMEAVDSKDDLAVRKRDNYNKSEVIRNNAEQEFDLNRDLNRFASKITGTIGKDGQRFSRSDANDYIYGAFLPNLYFQRKITREQITELLKQEAAGDPKKRPHSVFYSKRVQALEKSLDQIDTERYTKLNRQRTEKAREGTDIGIEALKQWTERGGSPAELVDIRNTLQLQYPNSDFSALNRVIISNNQEQNDDYWTQVFQEASNTGTLSAQQVMNANASPQLKAQYFQESLRQDKARQGLNVPTQNVSSDLNATLSSALAGTKLPVNKNGQQLALNHAMRLYNEDIAAQIRNNEDNPNFRVDQEGAIARVKTKIQNGEGKFARFEVTDLKKDEPFGVYFPAFTPKTKETPRGILSGSATEVGIHENEAAASLRYQKMPQTIKTEQYLTNKQAQDLAQDIENDAANPRIPPFLEYLYYQNPQNYKTIEDFVNDQLASDPIKEVLGKTYSLKPGLKTTLRGQTSDPNILNLIQKARTNVELRNAAAATNGGATDFDRYSSPVVANYLRNKAGGDGFERHPTYGHLEYNKYPQEYENTWNLLSTQLGLTITEQGKMTSGHSSAGYHPHAEAADVYVMSERGRAADIKETGRIKAAIRQLNLFNEVIGPGDNDPNHESHLHLGGLRRRVTMDDIKILKQILGYN